MKDLIYYIWLSGCKDLTHSRQKYLVELFGGARNLYEAGEAELAGCMKVNPDVFGRGPKLRFLLNKNLDQAQGYLDRACEWGASFLSYDNPGYPGWLKEIVNPPMVLYLKGRIELLHAPGIAIVGTRRSSQYGRWAAYEIAARIAACGVPVISGMAEGIDSAAHLGCLSKGTGTIAVFGTGIDLCFPASNRNLCRQIREEGLTLSEFPPGEHGMASYFPLRNRIISALSKSVIVVEGAIKSGSIITANLAAEQGRDVFAVPGNINQPNSVGPNRLIADGAFPIMDLDTAASVLGLSSAAAARRQAALSPEEKHMLSIVASEGNLPRELLFKTYGGPAQNAAALLTVLEMKGCLKSEGSKIYVAK
jgi:DNA processing protein